MGGRFSKENSLALQEYYGSKKDEAKKKEEAAAMCRQGANWKTSAFCNKQLRDPLTLAISFMAAPGPFRGVCSFTLECWDHARYLEVALGCSVALTDSTKRSFPLTLQCLEQLPIEQEFNYPFQRLEQRDLTYDCTLTFVSETAAVGEPAPAHKFRFTVLAATRRRATSIKHLVSGLELKHNKLQSVGPYWLYGCMSLKSVTLVGMPELTTVSFDWLSDCVSLESVTFERLPKLQSVGDAWLRDCFVLKSVTLVDLPELREVGRMWVQDCSSLEEATFERLPKLESVGAFWLCGCFRLKSVTFRDLPELSTIGVNWLDGSCSSLESATFCRIPKLQQKDVEKLLAAQSLPPQCKVVLNLLGVSEQAECTEWWVLASRLDYTHYSHLDSAFESPWAVCTK